MLIELASGFMAFFALWIIGLGPIIWLSRSWSPSQTGALLGLAAGFGVALVTIVAFPLYRYVGPVASWGWPVFALMLLASTIMVWLRREQAISLLNRDTAALSLALGVAGSALIILPLHHGFDRVMVSYNPSDALTYLTLADSVLHVPWLTLTKGSALNSSEESAAVIVLSPTGLYSARFVVRSAMRLATMVDLAWFAHIAGMGVERLLYVFSLALSLASVGVFYASSRLAGAGRKAAVAASLAGVLGFWAFMFRDHDAYGQIHIQPLLGLFFFGWSVASTGAHDRSGAIIVAALAFAACICAYTEFTVALLPLLAMMSATLWMRGVSLRSVAVSSISVVAGAFAILVFSAQFMFHTTILIRQFMFVNDAKSAIGSPIFEWLLRSEPVHGVFGTWWLKEALERGFFLQHDTAGVISYALAIIALVALAILLVSSLLRSTPTAAAAATIFIITLVIASVPLILKGDVYSSFKAYSTTFAFVFIAASAVPISGNRLFLPTSISSAAGLLIFALQGLFGLWYIARDVTIGPPPYAMRIKAAGYELATLRQVLDSAKVNKLIVYVPPRGQWWHSAFLMLSVRSYAPFFQSGYLIDNNDNRLNHRLISPPADADHILVAIDDDFIAGTEDGKLVAEHGSLRLYRITGSMIDPFRYRDSIQVEKK